MQVGRKSENRDLPIRATVESAEHAWRRARLLWQLVVASLFIEPIVLLLLLASVPPGVLHASDWLDAVIFGLWILALFFIAEGPIRNLGRTMRRVSDQYPKLARLLLAAGIVALPILEILSHSQSLTPALFIFLGIVLFGGYRYWREYSRRVEATHRSYRADPLRKIADREGQLAAVAITPALLSRAALVLCGLRWQILTNESALYYVSVAACIVVLLASMPTRDRFIARCANCSREASWIAVELGVCPGCARELFAVRQAENQPLPEAQRQSDTPGKRKRGFFPFNKI